MAKIEFSLHAGPLSGGRAQDVEVKGALSLDTAATVHLHCDDEASLRALATMFQRAADEFAAIRIGRAA